jgi:hypothetical protein
VLEFLAKSVILEIGIKKTQIGKEEVKLLIFSDDMISQKTRKTLISDKMFGKVAGFKINTLK